MKNQLFAFLVISLVLASCQPEGRVFSENKELSPDLEWKKKDIRRFQIPIEITKQKYDQKMAFRYASGFQFDKLQVRVTVIDPDDIASIYQYDLKVRDENGEYIGEPGLDIWDSEHLVEKGITFDKKGTYTFIIEHTMPQNPLNFAMEIGLILDEAK